MKNPIKKKERVIFPRTIKKKQTFWQKYGPKAWFNKLSKKPKNVAPPPIQPFEQDAMGPLKKHIAKNIPKQLSNTSIDPKVLAGLAKDPEFLKGVDVQDLADKWNRPGSKTQLVEKFMEDYTKGVSYAELQQKSRKDIERLKKANLDVDQFTKQQAVYMLHNYARRPKKNRFWSQGNFPPPQYRYSKDVKYLDRSQRDKLDKVITDYNSGNFSTAGIPIDAKLTKSQFETLLNNYDKKQRRFFIFIVEENKIVSTKVIVKNNMDK